MLENTIKGVCKGLWVAAGMVEDLLEPRGTECGVGGNVVTAN